MGTIKTIEGKDFRRMQLLQLGMMAELDRVCRKHNIGYVIFCGTLLGAVRHRGYIPWDDDADIAMLREDYEKFKAVCNELNSDICFFQDNTTDKYYRWGYGKLRRTGTSFIRVGQEHIKCKTGVFIDVFPLDDVPKSTIGQIIQDFNCFLLRKITYSEVAKVSKKGISRFFWNAISRIPIEWVFKRLLFYTRKSSNKPGGLVRILMYKSLGKLYKKAPIRYRYGFPKQWILERQQYIFEGHLFYGIKNYDAFLTLVYGDYMQMPEESKRNPHAPVSEYSF